MLSIFLIPALGLLISFLINTFLPKAQFSGLDLLPLFFIPACGMITKLRHQPSFLPYGFLMFFILVLWVALETAIKNKNISLWKTLYELWRYLSVSSILWYIGLVFFVLM
ncbi:DUF3397 family protein [Lactobacillus pasteurii]|uniref:Integral membrane protein n=1 Tax=Lactobacillus pasteurii DSM 23907 = CRBIP 24.76 TaxID=1423790 RepID=I7J032_9LACO|nr:DUF3397 family protein [Lactobacillus pasteurii]TDG76476.1 hypothetical protein C5L33_001235 [Lactobacillus pasteurii]CCI85432.1 Putative uncharacterized protein [Lactobacillus pasteurii DSM 23907 = CRBIP 24.76]